MISKVFGVLGKIFIIAGILILGFVGYQWQGTKLEMNRGQNDLSQALVDMIDTSTEVADVGAEPTVEELSVALAKIDPVTAPPMAPPPEGEPAAIIAIDKIGVQHVVVEGVSRADLKKGPGHYPGTPLPGQAGNAAIAGHRTTYGAPFHRIDELVPGDVINVATPQGGFTYRVLPAPDNPDLGWYAVKPNQVEVIGDFGDNRLTLTACHPKYSARERIIVHAELITEVAETLAEPVDTTVDEIPDESVVSSDFDEGLGGDPDALAPAIIFGLGAFAFAAFAWFVARVANKWLIYGLASPGVLLLIWFMYVNLDRYLPAL